jgi:hypothetical protein
VAEDAVRCELVSAIKFPANREINREFCWIWPSTAIFVSSQRADSIAYSGIPYTTEQGISKDVSGKIFQGTGNLHSHASLTKLARALLRSTSPSEVGAISQVDYAAWPIARRL